MNCLSEEWEYQYQLMPGRFPSKDWGTINDVEVPMQGNHHESLPLFDQTFGTKNKVRKRISQSVTREKLKLYLMIDTYFVMIFLL